MARHFKKHTQHFGELIKQDGRSIPFQFSVLSGQSSYNNEMGVPITKGEYRIVSDSLSEAPVTNKDKIASNLSHKPFLVGDVDATPKRSNTHRNGKIPMVYEIWLK